MMTTRKEIVVYAKELLGVKYQHQGRISINQEGKVQSTDCVGLAVYIGQKLGMEVNPWINYGLNPIPEVMKAEIDKHLIRVKYYNLGSVVWLKGNGIDATHLAIIADYPAPNEFSIIHAYNSAGLDKVVQHRLDDSWKKRIVAVWDFPEIKEVPL